MYNTSYCTVVRSLKSQIVWKQTWGLEKRHNKKMASNFEKILRVFSLTWKTKKFLALIRIPSFSSSSLYSGRPTTLLLMRYSEEEPEKHDTCKLKELNFIWHHNSNHIRNFKYSCGAQSKVLVGRHMETEIWAVRSMEKTQCRTGWSWMCAQCGKVRQCLWLTCSSKGPIFKPQNTGRILEKCFTLMFAQLCLDIWTHRSTYAALQQLFSVLCYNNFHFLN